MSGIAHADMSYPLKNSFDRLILDEPHISNLANFIFINRSNSLESSASL